MNYKDILIVDLNSGSYIKDKEGHEKFNLEMNEKTKKYYGYVPPYSTVTINNFSSYKKGDEFVDEVLVVYVTTLQTSKDRKIIAFSPNSRVYSKPQMDESLNRVIITNDKIEHIVYSIESNDLIDLRMLGNPYVINIKEYNSYMFRAQRVYGEKYIDLSHELLDYYREFEHYQNIDELEDYSFQIDVNNETISKVNQKVLNAHKNDIKLVNGNYKHVNRNPKVSKIAIINSGFKCQYNSKHTTFINSNGKNYMEGHHLIPCTPKNLIYFKEKFDVSIDCVSNIVSLCANCHRAIHFGNEEIKREMISHLYNLKIDELNKIGIELKLQELLRLYNIKGE